MKIWVHTIVCNEDRFLWFAVMSVVDYVDRVMIWDTGSEDKTVEIIKEIIKTHGDKIIFKEVGRADRFQFTQMRQKMLNETEADWILILDGDEIWWKSSIKKVVDTIKKDGDKIDAIVVPFYVPLGDIYHYQEELAGQYKLLGRKGHCSLRLINKNIPGLHIDLPYGQEGYFDKDNLPIQQRQKVIFIDAPYFHTTHLPRSSTIRLYNKVKFELGSKFPEGFTYPEIFSLHYPSIVSSPWQNAGFRFLLLAAILTIPRKMKRRFVKFIV